MKRSISAIALAAGVGLVFAGHVAKADPFPNYHLLQTIPVPSSASNWDYVTYDPATKQLFVGHVDDGVEVFDTANGFKMTKLAGATPSGGVVLIPDFGLGVAHIDTGSFEVFKTSDLSVVKTFQIGPELDSVIYDPVTHIIIPVGANYDDTKNQDRLDLYSVPDFNKIGSITVPDSDLEHSVADGQGNIFLNGQRTGHVFKIDLKSRSIVATYPTTSCLQPTGLAYNKATHRLYIGCRGKINKPEFIVMNADNGNIVYSAPITADNDDVAFDPKNGYIFLTDGVGPAMFVFHDDGSDKYSLSEVLTTSAFERTMALDVDDNLIYTIAAEGLVDPSKYRKPKNYQFYPNRWVANTFSIRVYGQ